MFGDNKLGTGVSTVKILWRNIDGVRPEFWDICLRQLTIIYIVLFWPHFKTWEMSFKNVRPAI